MAALYDPATDTVRVVRREASGRIVTLRRGYGDLFGKPTPPYLLDEETASRWDFTGRAVSGHMQGHRLPLFSSSTAILVRLAGLFPALARGIGPKSKSYYIELPTLISQRLKRLLH